MRPRSNSLLVALAALVAAGCGVGMGPAPMKESEVKAAIDGMTPEQRIKYIESSPLPPAEKKRRIAEIRNGTGPVPPKP